MGIGSKLSKTKFVREIAREVTGQLLRQSQKLDERLPVFAKELASIVQHPRSLGAWLETQSPWLNRKFLGAASNIAEPFVAGMGLTVERLAEEVCEVAMPGNLRNRGESGGVHTGALTVLGEFAGRLYLEHHLDLRHTEIEVRRVQVRLVGRAVGDLKGVFRMSVAEKALLFKLRSQESAETESQTLLYDREGRLVAEVEVDWEVRRQFALSPGAGHEKDEKK